MHFKLFPKGEEIENTLILQLRGYKDFFIFMEDCEV